MKIIRAEIVGTRMAEEGSGGYTVNSTSYSVLLFYDNGDVNLVEGDAKDIKPYLRYIQPQNDMTQLQSLLEKIEEKLKRDFDKIIEKNIEKVYNAAYPIPQVKGRTYGEAKTELEKNGFIVEVKNMMHKPNDNDIVQECFRKTETMRTILVRLIPDVRGLSPEETISKLSGDVFNATLKAVYNEEYQDREIIRLEFSEESDYDIAVVYNDLSLIKNENAEIGFMSMIESYSSIADIYDAWKTYNLASKHKNIDTYIIMKLDTEKRSGHLGNIEQVKEAIISLLQKES